MQQDDRIAATRLQVTHGATGGYLSVPRLGSRLRESRCHPFQKIHLPPIHTLGCVQDSRGMPTYQQGSWAVKKPSKATYSIFCSHLWCLEWSAVSFSRTWRY